MKQGIVNTLLEYYLHEPQFQEDILRSAREFFDRPDLEPNNQVPLQLSEEEIPLINEWLIFDFKLSNGKTLLEDFAERNPYRLPPEEIKAYRDLTENSYGLYEVKEARWGEGLQLRNLQTNKQYWVREFKGTFQTGAGDVLATRVGRVADHYELVGAGVTKMPIALTPESRKLFREIEDGWNLKTTRETFFSAPEEEKEHAPVSFNEAKDNLEHALKKYNLAKYVTSDGIERWIRENIGSKEAMAGPHLLLGIAQRRDKELLQDAMEDIIHVYTSFANVCPQKILQGKSPTEKMAEQERRENEEFPRFIFSANKFSPDDWAIHYNEGINLMRHERYEAAIQSYNTMFHELLAQHTTFSEVFRPYANKAVCHFAVGERYLGEQFLAIALELNPRYDFAQMQMERYLDGELDDLIDYHRGLLFAELLEQSNSLLTRAEKRHVRYWVWGRTAHLLFDHKHKQKGKTEDAHIREIEERLGKKKLSRDTGYRYWRFLKPFRINFAHPLEKPSRITAPKQGRNDPCLCGSGKKFKKCHGSSSREQI